jgi:hypothetical protein
MKNKLQILEIKKNAEFVEFCEVNEKLNSKLGELVYLERIKKNIGACALAFMKLASVSNLSIKDSNRNLEKNNYDFSSHCKSKAFRLRGSLEKTKSLEANIKLALKSISEDLWLRKQKLNQLEKLILEKKRDIRRRDNALQELEIEELIMAKVA